MATITVCETCRYDAETRQRDGVSAGAAFAALVEAAAAPHAAVAVRRHACLMACSRHCATALSAPGKMTYVLGAFEPTAEDAAAMVEYAAKYAASDSGVVPFRDWPQGVKGHFVSRVPPLDG
ncbi:MAG: DUF1636 domain-containing protein [Pseudomonadota bacterium]